MKLYRNIEKTATANELATADRIADECSSRSALAPLAAFGWFEPIAQLQKAFARDAWQRRRGWLAVTTSSGLSQRSRKGTSSPTRPLPRPTSPKGGNIACAKLVWIPMPSPAATASDSPGGRVKGRTTSLPHRDSSNPTPCGRRNVHLQNE